MNGYKPSKISKLNIITKLYLAYFDLWIQHAVPRWLLHLSIVIFGFLGIQYVFLWAEIGAYIWPSIKAIANWSPEAPMLLAIWSYAILFTAMCLRHKCIAASAMIQLYRRFKVLHPY